MSLIEKTLFKDLGEGYCVLSTSKVFASVEWVDWLEEDGQLTEATLSDDSILRGSGNIELHVIWHEDIEKLSAAELATVAALDPSIQIL